MFRANVCPRLERGAPSEIVQTQLRRAADDERVGETRGLLHSRRILDRIAGGAQVLFALYEDAVVREFLQTVAMFVNMLAEEYMCCE